MPNPQGPIPRDELFPGSELKSDELEFIQALEAFKKRYRRRYPTWSEVLLVLKSLGYRRVCRESRAVQSPEQKVHDAPSN